MRRWPMPSRKNTVSRPDLPDPPPMRLSINHTTRYQFAEPVAYGVQRLRMTPKATQGQRIIDWTMTFQGAHEELSYDDQNFNHVTLISVLPDVRELVIACSGTVATEDYAGVIGRHAGHLPLWSFLNPTPLTRSGPRLRQMLGMIDRRSDDVLSTLHRLSAVVREHVDYQPGTTHVNTVAEEALAAGKGVCQDHAHIFIAVARAMDVPARYVSGYLMMDEAMEQEATHAWAEAWVEGLGWVGFDVSNQICPDLRYVRVATGRDYSDAAPVTGVSFGSTVEDLHVALTVEQQTVEQ
jgi:transglutaminase-like putative cysteine protease